MSGYLTPFMLWLWSMLLQSKPYLALQLPVSCLASPHPKTSLHGNACDLYFPPTLTDIRSAQGTEIQNVVACQVIGCDSATVLFLTETGRTVWCLCGVSTALVRKVKYGTCLHARPPAHSAAVPQVG